MQPSIVFIVDNFLTVSEKKMLFALKDGVLKKRINQLLLSDDTLHWKIAKVTLEIIHRTDESESRDKFLNAVLVESDHKIMSKILQITDLGLFEEIINQFNYKKKEYITPQHIKRLIESFDSSQSKKIQPYVNSSNDYQELMNCSYYYELPKKADNYAKKLGDRVLSEKFKFLFQQLNTNYNKILEEKICPLRSLSFVPP